MERRRGAYKELALTLEPNMHDVSTSEAHATEADTQ